MAQYDDIIDGYRDKQAAIRRQIATLRAMEKLTGGQTDNPVATATIHRAERQIADLDDAIARCGEKLLVPQDRAPRAIARTRYDCERLWLTSLS